MIFVVDCASPEKLPEAAEAVAEVMSIGALSGLPLVVFCNKCDQRHGGQGCNSIDIIGMSPNLNLITFGVLRHDMR